MTTSRDEREALVKRLEAFSDREWKKRKQDGLARGLEMVPPAGEYEQLLLDAIAALTAQQGAGEPVAWIYTLVVDGQTVSEQITHVNWNPEYQPFGRNGVDHGGKVSKTPLYAAPPVTAQPAGEPVAVVRRSMTGGNAGLSRHVEITADFILNDGELLYTHPPAAPRSTRT